MGSCDRLELKVERKWGAEGSSAPPGGLTLCSPVCTAGLDLPLTTEPLEAPGTEAEESARLVHTGTPVEARG